MKRIMIFLLLTALVLLPLQGGLTEEAQSYTPEQLLQYWHQVISLMREAEVYPYVELREGDRGYEVMFLQARLAQLLYYGKTISPQFGSGTRAAMRMFERVNKLPVNGIASVEDQKLLFSSRALSNPGTPAGLDPGQTPPPDNGGWPDLDPPDWWPAFPKIPLVTPGVEIQIDPDITDGLDPGAIITPSPKPIATIMPGLPDLGIDTRIDPDLLVTEPPLINPGLDLDIPKP